MKSTFIFINGIKREVTLNQTIMQACESYGVKIPHFCFHDKLSVAGNCRMCLVEETKKSAKPLQASCAITVVPDMSVYTNTALVKKAREGVLEFLLANHPLDCPICDQGGECDLQDQSLVFGSDRGRFYENKRAVEDKNFGPLVKTVMTRCIHCTRCVRFAREIAGLDSFGITGRGAKMEIGFYIKNQLSSEISGNIIDVCPVGALTSKPYAFKARPWDLMSHNNIDLFDAFGSNIRVDVLNNKIVRILPKVNKQINDCWISDKVRFSYDSYKLQRLMFPLLKSDSSSFNKTTWENSFNMLNSFLKKFNPESLLQLWNIPENASLETQISAVNYFRSCGSAFFIPNATKYSFDFRSELNTKSLLIDNLVKKDVVLLINTSPKIESASFNTYLRKLALAGSKIFTIGFFNNLNYNATSLGSDLSVLSKIVEGKHYFCHYLAVAKNPLILYSSGIIDLPIYSTVITLQSIVLKFKVSLKNFISILPQHAYEPNMYELALSSNTMGFIDSLKKHFSAVLIFNSNFTVKSSLFENYNGSKFLVACSPYGSKNLLDYDMLLPVCSNFEMEEYFLNLQGFLQKTKPIFLNTGLSLTYSKFFDTLLNTVTNNNKIQLDYTSIRLKNVLGYNLECNNTPIISKLDWFAASFVSKKRFFSTKAVFLSSNISNFYISSQSLTSRIMALCSKQFISNNTFFGK